MPSPPDVEVEQEGVLKRVADYLARLSATGTVVALVMGAARGTHMLFLGERGYLVRQLFPLAEPPVPFFYICHTAYKGTKK